MFHSSSSQIHKTLARTAARIAVFSFLAAFLFLAGLAYANLDGQRSVPAGQESVVPIRAETQMPSGVPTKPMKATTDTLRVPVKPVRYFPAVDGDQAIPTLSEPVQIAGISAYLVPTDSQQQGAYAIPQMPSLLSGK